MTGIICKLAGTHKWVMDGARPCPRGVPNCSQTVFRCKRCGTVDYGRAGYVPTSPGWGDCMRRIFEVREGDPERCPIRDAHDRRDD